MKSSRFLFFLGTAAALLATDQGVKYWIRGNLRIGQSIGSPLPGFFEITHTENHGIAFGMFQGGGVFFAPVAILMAIALAVWSYRKPNEPWHFHLAIGLLASGALGNLYDRVRYGKVTDMFWFRAIDFPVFNVADACITVGAAIMIVLSLFERKQSPQAAVSEP